MKPQRNQIRFRKNQVHEYQVKTLGIVNLYAKNNSPFELLEFSPTSSSSSKIIDGLSTEVTAINFS